MYQQFNSTSPNTSGMSLPSTSFYTSPALASSFYHNSPAVSSDSPANSSTTQLNESYVSTQWSTRPSYDWSNYYYGQSNYFNQSLDYASASSATSCNQSLDTSSTDLSYTCSNNGSFNYGLRSSPYVNQYQVINNILK